MGRKYLASLAVCLGAVGFGLDAGAEPWGAPSGLHGGGLGMNPDQSVRIWTDVAFFTRGESTTTVGPGFVVTQRGMTVLSPIFGVGIELSPQAELEAILPTGFLFTDPENRAGIGNPYVGASFVMQGPNLRIKAGGGIAFPVISSDSDSAAGPVSGLYPRALQSAWLFAPDSLAIVAPVHIEAPLGTPVLFIGDATPFMLIPVRNTDRNENEVFFELAPGFGGYVSDDFILGVRMPLVLQMSGRSTDRAQVSLEPFMRYASDPVFFSLRFTMPLDEPLGFAFDTGKVWGIHAGLGAGF